MRRTLLVIALTLTFTPHLFAAAKPAKDPVTVKTLEAQADAAKADLDKARAAALPEWQTVPEYRNARSDLDAKKAALDKARDAGTEKDKTETSDAYTKSKIDFDKVIQSLENTTETIVAKRKA
jgi:hypothetical protein